MGVVHQLLGSVCNLDNLSREQTRQLKKLFIILNMRKPIYELTRAKFFFKLRNTLYFLIDLRSAMSPSNGSAYSTVSAM